MIIIQAFNAGYLRSYTAATALSYFTFITRYPGYDLSVRSIIGYCPKVQCISMNHNSDRSDESIARSTTEDNNNINQEATITKDIKNRMDKTVKDRDIDGDPTRSEE